MFRSNGTFIHFVFLFLVSTCVFTTKCTSMLHGSSPCIRQEQCFHRPDPLHRLKAYDGGYDIANNHYWASAAFTGIHGYAMAAMWTLCGIGLGIFVLLKQSSSPRILHSNSHYFITLTFLLLFIFLAIIANSFSIAASQNSFKRTIFLKKTILNVGESACETIGKVTKSMVGMQHIISRYDQAITHRLNSTNVRLEKTSRSIRHFIQEKGHLIDVAISTLYIAHLATASVNLVLLVAALGWFFFPFVVDSKMFIMTNGLLLSLSSAFLTLAPWVNHHNLYLLDLNYSVLGSNWHRLLCPHVGNPFAEDTCAAFHYYEKHPDNNSLYSIIPCIDRSYGNKILVEIGSNVHNFITELNTKVTALYTMYELYEKGVGAFEPFKICDPFLGAPNYSYLSRKCPTNTIHVGDLPSKLERFTCYNMNSTKACQTSGKFLPEEYFVMAWSYSQFIQRLIDIFPDLQSLAHCSFVREAFDDIVARQCRPFRVWFRLLWISMLSLSIFMVSFVLILVVKGYQDRGKVFSMCSIVPTNPRHVQV